MYTTYDMSATNDRDVSKIVVNVAPKDSPLYSLISEGSMVARYKETVTDTYAGGTAIVAANEGAALTAEASVARGVHGNYAQIFTKVISVAGTQEQVLKYGGVQSERAYQIKKKFIELAKDIEYSFINGTASAGSTATTTAGARRMAGLQTIASTNTSTASGAAATGAGLEVTINNLLQTIFESGPTANTIMVGGTKKRQISGFTTNTRNIDSAIKKLVNVVNVYESDFGEVDIILNRYVAATQLFAFDISGFRTSYLRKLVRESLGKTGDSTEEAVIGELTLDYDDELMVGKCTFS